jgi:NitT/TauT family transport system ATP-binding protein
MTARPRLSLRDVRKTYGDAHDRDKLLALDGISLDIAAKEFVVIVGPSGCGKSTLLRIAAGLTPPTTGEVVMDGTTVTAPPPRLVYLFQQYSKSLFAWRTVLQNVMFPIEAAPRAQRSRQREQCLQYLRQVGLDGFEEKYPWQLSGGMQQRVAIARALAAEPDVLLLDEPFSAVDALTRMELQSLVLDLWRAKGFTAVLVTHDVEEAIFLADRVVVLSGRPSTVSQIVPVPLPRPRNQLTTREDRRFLELRHHLMTSLLGSKISGNADG